MPKRVRALRFTAGFHPALYMFSSSGVVKQTFGTIGKFLILIFHRIETGGKHVQLLGGCDSSLNMNSL